MATEPQRAAIRTAILEFDWSNYGLDVVGDLVHDEGALAWADNLTHEIAKAVQGSAAPTTVSTDDLHARIAD